MRARRAALVVAVAAAIAIAAWFHHRGSEKPASSSAPGASSEILALEGPTARGGRPGAGASPARSSLVTITGRVVDETDRSPVASAEVVLRNELGEASAQTRADGTFTVEVARGDYRVAVRGAGVLTAELAEPERVDATVDPATVGAPDESLMPLVHTTADLASLELAAAPAATILGHVVDADGAPVAHVVVRARGLDVKPALGTDSGETDAHGDVALEVPAGRYVLDARAPGFAGLAQGAEVIARPHASQKVGMQIARGCEVRGRVVRADGKPAGDGAIERLDTSGAGSFRPTGHVDPDGSFRWTTVERGEVAIRAWPWKAMPTEVRVFDCKDGARFDNVVLHVPVAGASLAGRLVDAAGQPVPFGYIDVHALDVRAPSQQERADADGTWEVHELAAGHYQISASAPGRGLAVTTAQVPRPDPVELRLAGTGRIEGTTTSLANGTLEVAFVACFDALDLNRRPQRIASEPRLVTVAGGRFAIEDAPACDLQLVARWRDQLVNTRVAVPPAGIAHLELLVGPPREKLVHGIVRDRGASAVANVRVTASLEGRASAAATTDQDGRFTLHTYAGAALAASDGARTGRALVGRANLADEEVDVTLDQ